MKIFILILLTCSLNAFALNTSENSTDNKIVDCKLNEKNEVSCSCLNKDKPAYTIEATTVCYEKCKPRRKIMGVLGAKEHGFDRDSCVQCVNQNSHIYQVKETIHDVIKPGSKCYSECKPTKSVLGVLGSTKFGVERKECLVCMRKYPKNFKLSQEYAQETFTQKCEISNDGRYAICEGVTYKRDDSVSDIERNIIKDRSDANSDQKSAEGSSEQ